MGHERGTLSLQKNFRKLYTILNNFLLDLYFAEIYCWILRYTEIFLFTEMTVYELYGLDGLVSDQFDIWHA